MIAIGLRFKVPVEIDLMRKSNIRLPNQPQKVYTFSDHVVLNPGPKFVVPAAEIVKDIIFIAQSVQDISDLGLLEKKLFDETWKKWNSSSEVVGSGIDITVQSPSTDSSCNCVFENDDNFIFSPPKRSSIIASNQGQSENEDTIEPESKNRSDTRIHGHQGAFQQRRLSKDSIRSTESFEANLADVEELADKRVRFDLYRRRTPSSMSQSDQSEDIDKSHVPSSPTDHTSELYIGHPRPPHHMVVDNDLQSPFCHMLRKPVELRKAHLRDVTHTEDESFAGTRKAKRAGRCLQLEGHVLVCADTYGLWTYLCTMRASIYAPEHLRPILIMCPFLPSEEEWRPLSVFPYVYFMRGSVLKRNDLIKAGLHSASCVLMMQQGRSRHSKLVEERYIDSTAIMGTHQIDFMVKDKYVITELGQINVYQ
jgi:hypothetical protein